MDITNVSDKTVRVFNSTGSFVVPIKPGETQRGLSAGVMACVASLGNAD